MPIRLVDSLASRLGSMAVTTEGTTTDFDSTNVPPQNNTGVVKPVLSPATSVLSGTSEVSGNRTGTIATTTDDHVAEIGENIIWIATASQGSGNGDSPGNAATLATIPTLGPGNVIYLQPGDYTQQPIILSGVNGTPSARIRFQASDVSNKPVIKGNASSSALGTAISLTNSSYITFDGINVSGERSGDNRYPRWTIGRLARLVSSDNIRFLNCTMRYANTWPAFEVGTTDDVGSCDYFYMNNCTIQYGGAPDKFQDADGITASETATQNVTAQPDVVDLLSIGEGSRYALIENSDISYGGHTPLALHGEFNIVRNCTQTNSYPTAAPNAGWGTVNITTSHPFHSDYTGPFPQSPTFGRQFLNGNAFGNRHLGTRGGTSNGNYSGRNVIENCTITAVEEAIDDGQIARIAGTGTIYRFNTVLESNSRSGMGITGTTTRPERHVYRSEVYNNEFTDIDSFRGDSQRPFARMVGTPSTRSGCAWNRYYNNAHGAFNANAYKRLGELNSNTWQEVNTDHPNVGDSLYPTLTNALGENYIQNNTYVDATNTIGIDTALGDFSTMTAAQADGTVGNYVSGNQGGAFKRNDAGGYSAIITQSSGTSDTVTVSTTSPFVAPNLYLQLTEGDEVFIHGPDVRVKITSIDEANLTLTFDQAVTWTTNDGISLSAVTDNFGRITTGATI